MANVHASNTAHHPTRVDDHHDQPVDGHQALAIRDQSKDIGTMYLVFSLIMFFIGGAMAMLIRAELFKPGLQLMDRVLQSDDQNHALIMIFGASCGLRRLGDWMIPCRSARRTWPAAHEQFQLLDPALRFTCCCRRCFVPGGMAAAGWTLYPPLSLQTGDAFPMLIFAIT